MRDILLGVLLPMVVSGVLVYMGRGALAVAVGFLAGWVAIFGWAWRPGNQFEWVGYGVALAGVVGTAAEVVKFRVGWIWGVVVAGLAGMLVWGTVSIGVLVAVMAVGWVWWGLWDELVKRSSRQAWDGVVMTGVAGFGSLGLMLSDSQRFGQMGLALVGACVGVWLLEWWPGRRVSRGAGLVWAVAMYGLLVNGKFWAGLSWMSAVLLLVAPLLAWVGEMPRVRNLTGWKRSAVRVGAVVVPVAVAVVMAIVEFQRAQAASGSEYY